jgi:hypothetical protein
MQGVRRLPGQPPSQVVAQSKLPRARCPAHGLMHRRVWSYERPTERFEPIAGYFSFYAIPFECWVDEERVQAQVGHPARAVVGAVLGAGAQARRPRPLAAGCLHGGHWPVLPLPPLLCWYHAQLQGLKPQLSNCRPPPLLLVRCCAAAATAGRLLLRRLGDS